ncbi:MAG TPA: hypothetical protein VFG30_15925 [Polyangiales bacterium]|nr:hypothetical protein [Polyangiales bacterium]
MIVRAQYVLLFIAVLSCVSLAVRVRAQAPVLPPSAAPPSAAPDVPAPPTAAAATDEAATDLEIGTTSEQPAAPALPSPVPAEPAAPTGANETPAAAELPVAAPPEASPTAPQPPAAEQSTLPASTPAPATSTAVLAKAGYPLTPGVTATGYDSGFVLSGYLQAQYEWHQDSVDQQAQGGTLLNRDRFLLRRGRVRVAKDWDWGQAIVELDGNTSRGPTVRLQKAEVSVLYGRSDDLDQPPIVQLTLGQFDLPFGFETTYASKARWFMERSQMGRAFFPGEPDVGARLSGGTAVLRYAIAVTNGEPLDERSGFGLQDPNSNKDITARFGAQTKFGDSFVIAGGVSWNQGKGYHPGTDAVKTGVAFRDLNENGSVDNGELFGTPATQAVPAKNFTRWAVGADLQCLLRTALGWSMLYGELVLASNLDRGLVIADPVLSGSDVRELGYYVAFTQEITRYGAAGFRYDVYDPNADFLDKRGGKLIPNNQTVRTYSPFIGLTLSSLRLVFQWDIVDDHLARDTRGVPSDLANNQWTLRLQGAL